MTDESPLVFSIQGIFHIITGISRNSIATNNTETKGTNEEDVQYFRAFSIKEDPAAILKGAWFYNYLIIIIIIIIDLFYFQEKHKKYSISKKNKINYSISNKDCIIITRIQKSRQPCQQPRQIYLSVFDYTLSPWVLHVSYTKQLLYEDQDN